MNMETILIVTTGIVGTLILIYSFIKKYIGDTTRKWIEQAIQFANQAGLTQRDKLVRAVTFIENKIIEKVPVFLKSLVDLLINAEWIADQVEKEITKKKMQTLAIKQK